MPRFKHPNNRYERRLVNQTKTTRRNGPRRKENPMEQVTNVTKGLRILELNVSSKHLEQQFISFLDALTMIDPDDEIVEVEGLPLPKGNIPIKIKFTKRIQPGEEVLTNS